MSAYPNPFTSELTVQLPQTKSAMNTIIRVMDVPGKIMLKQTTSVSSIKIGRMLPKGVYLLQVVQENVRVYQTTILKQQSI